MSNNNDLKAIKRGLTVDLLDHVKPNKDCYTCEIDENYTCISCEGDQVKEKYPNAFYNDDCQWELKI
jgi:hypothetical protein